MEHTIYRHTEMRYRQRADHPGRHLNDCCLTRTYDLCKPADAVRYVARQRWTWPGGYSLSYFNDDACLCSACLRDRYAIELRDAIDGTVRQAGVVCGADIDAGEYYCGHCGRDLSDYAEQD